MALEIARYARTEISITTADMSLAVVGKRSNLCHSTIRPPYCIV